MVFKDLEESLMIFGESSKIVIFMNVVQVVGQPLLDIHSGNLTAAIIVYMTAASSAAS